MNRNTVRAIVNVCRLDIQRGLGGGKYTALLMVLLLPALAALMGFSSDNMPSDMPFGVLTGAGCGMFAMTAMYVFFYESQGKSGWMNGVIPVSRVHQVLGRYLFMALVGVVMAAELGVCALIMNAMRGADAGMLWSDADTGIVFGALVPFVLVESLMYPLLYRFPAQKAIIAAMIALFAALFGFIALTDILPESAIAGLIEAVAWLSDHAVASILASVAAVAAALGVSILCSVRIYRAKEL